MNSNLFSKDFLSFMTTLEDKTKSDVRINYKTDIQDYYQSVESITKSIVTSTKSQDYVEAYRLIIQRDTILGKLSIHPDFLTKSTNKQKLLISSRDSYLNLLPNLKEKIYKQYEQNPNKVKDILNPLNRTTLSSLKMDSSYFKINVDGMNSTMNSTNNLNSTMNNTNTMNSSSLFKTMVSPSTHTSQSLFSTQPTQSFNQSLYATTNTINTNTNNTNNTNNMNNMNTNNMNTNNIRNTMSPASVSGTTNMNITTTNVNNNPISSPNNTEMNQTNTNTFNNRNTNTRASNNIPQTSTNYSVTENGTIVYGKLHDDTVPANMACKNSGLSYTMYNTYVNKDLFTEFYRIAYEGIVAEPAYEVCGILAGTTKGDDIYVTHLIIPKQDGNSDGCSIRDDDYAIEMINRDIIQLGWIHTHPRQKCFLSSIDIHTTYNYHKLLNKTIAIVIAPYDSVRPCAVFRLLENQLSILDQCNNKEHHTHPDDLYLYEEAENVIYCDDKTNIVIV